MYEGADQRTKKCTKQTSCYICAKSVCRTLILARGTFLIFLYKKSLFSEGHVRGSSILIRFHN